MHAAPSPSYRLLRALVLAIWLLGTALLIWLLLVFPNQGAQVPYRDVVFEREPGEPLPRLAERLAKAQLVDSPRALVWYMRLLGADARLREGPVVANRALAPRDLVLRLARGFGRGRVRVPMPEGFTSFDMATRLERYGVCTRQAFERATRDPALLQTLHIAAHSAEGYLFPATYELTQDSQAPDVVRRMVRVFRERMNGRLKAYEESHDGESLALTLHQIVTLASIVEREARVPDERPTIAGVFMNRLTSPDF
ncbi:MAG TPA: endolytic transglycosylase MltG, partial [Polyangiales bacterium]